MKKHTLVEIKVVPFSFVWYNNIFTIQFLKLNIMKKMAKRPTKLDLKI